MEMRAYYVNTFSGDFNLYDHLQIKWVDIKELYSYAMPEPDMPIVYTLVSQV